MKNKKIKGYNNSKAKKIILLILSVTIYILLVLGVVYIYKTANIGDTKKRIIQNTVYIIFVLLSLVLMKQSNNPFSHYGLFLKKFPLQLIIGAASGIGIILFMFIFGNSPSFPENFLFVMLSQLLVALSEETFWRGYVLQTIWDVSESKDRAVLISSLLFGFAHLPLNGSIVQVIAAVIIGIFLSVIRTEFKEYAGIPALTVAHALFNIF